MSAATEIKRTIIIGLGKQGYQVVEEVEKRLQRRYRGIPVVQSIALVSREDRSLLALENEHDHALNQLPVLIVDPDDEPLGSKSRDAEVNTWLPDIPDLDLTYRAGARLALLGLYHQLKGALSELINSRLLNPQVDSEMEARNLRTPASGHKTIDIYLVANLGEPLASGLFIDLAYLIKKFCEAWEAGGLSFYLNGLLLLPQLASEWHSADVEARMRMQANSYAALKELDYYMNKQAYRLVYSKAGETVEYIKVPTPPFEPDFCYIIGQTNENIESISSADAAYMTAEWLCHATLASVASRLAAERQLQHYAAEQAIRTYSAFGFASLILPIRYIQDYCARRLTVDIVTSLLSTPDQHEQDERARLDSWSNRILPDSGELRRLLVGTKDENDRKFNISVTAYDGLSLLQAQDLETRLIHDYDHRLSTILPVITERMRDSKDELANQISAALVTYTRQIFVEDPQNAINRNISFLRHFQQTIQQRQSNLRNEIEHCRSRNYHRRIKEARGHYFNAAQTFGTLPRPWQSVLSAVAFLLFFGWVYYIFARVLDQTLLAVALTGIPLFLIISITLAARSLIGSTRTQFIERYNARLSNQHQLEEAQLEAELLKLTEEWVRDLLAQIANFRDEIRKLQQLAERRWQVDHGYDRPWNQLLYGHPYFSLEKSVIDEADLQAYYREVYGETPRDYSRHFDELLGTPAYGGTFYDWLNAARPIEELWRNLYEYTSQRAAILDRHHIVEKIEERFEREEVMEDIKKIKRYAGPYLKMRLGDLGEDVESSLRQVVAVHLKRDERTAASGSKVAKSLQALQLEDSVYDVGDKHRLSIITARHGLPLFILPDVVECYSGYRNVGNLSLVHTTRGNIALPDITGGQENGRIDADYPFELDPRQAFALSVAFSQYHSYPFTPLAFYYPDQQEAPPADGATGPAGYYQRYIERRQREIALRLNRAPRQNWQYLGPTKSEACRALFIDSQLLEYLREDLKAYLDSASWPDLLAYLDDYLNDATHFVDQDPHLAIEDWELVELVEAQDILVNTLPSPANSPSLTNPSTTARVERP